MFYNRQSAFLWVPNVLLFTLILFLYSCDTDFTQVLIKEKNKLALFFNFMCTHFHLPVATYHQHLHNGVYKSQLIRNFRACVSYYDFRYRGLLIRRKLVNQGFLLVNLKSSLLKCYAIITWLIITEYMFQMTMDMFNHVHFSHSSPITIYDRLLYF